MNLWKNFLILSPFLREIIVSPEVRDKVHKYSVVDYDSIQW